jgi:replicative DNA helicase
MINLNPCVGMKPGVSEADRQLVRWMFSQPPFDRKPYKKLFSYEAEQQFIDAVIKTGTLPPDTKEADFYSLENRQFIRACLAVQKRGFPLNAKNIGEQLQLAEYGPYYSEMAFLSCLLAGGGIPATVNESVFSDLRNRIIFRAIKRLETLGAVNFHCLVSFLTEFNMLQKCGGMAYLEKVESAMPVAYAIGALTTALLTKAVLREAA